ncbi:unnamed protein product [Ilex paraguariensis]|uniref:Late embryogenesis abundant protein LEA-2 subgroup domain-containing protein n=1 Tax=Ilex paraguariensis TaxID=185542 RepID=A0ABC8U2L4_9AQUA
MYRQRETNPHFRLAQEHLSPEHVPNLHAPSQPQPQNQHLQPQHGSNTHVPSRKEAQPQPHRHSRRKNLPPDSRQGSSQPQPQPQPQAQSQSQAQPQHSNQPTNGQHQAASLRVPTPHKTLFCALFWIIIIVGGLAILLVYVIFRPKSPKFDVSSATLNAAYLDMGYLLNADLTLLANFTNPNKKASVDFHYMVIGLYYGRDLIASRYIYPFSVTRRESKFANVHMITSQVRLSILQSQQLRREMEGGRVNFEVKGMFRIRFNLAGFLRYTYWLYGHCTIVVTGPPSGALVAKKCITKR